MAMRGEPGAAALELGDTGASSSTSRPVMQQDPGPAPAPTKAEAKAKAKAAKAKAKAAAGPLVPDAPLEMARKVLKVVMTQTTQARESALTLKNMKFSTELSAQLLECAAETEAIFQDLQRLVMVKNNDADDYMPVLQRVESAKQSYEDKGAAAKALIAGLSKKNKRKAAEMEAAKTEAAKTEEASKRRQS
jgi:hypothetical protein